MQILNIWGKGKLAIEISKFSSPPRKWVHVSLYLILCLGVKSFGVTIQIEIFRSVGRSFHKKPLVIRFSLLNDSKAVIFLEY